MKEEDEPMPNVEYVPEQLEVKGAALEAFSDVFARFQPPPESATVRAYISAYFLKLTTSYSRTEIETKRRVKLSTQMTKWRLKAILTLRRRSLCPKRRLER